MTRPVLARACLAVGFTGLAIVGGGSASYHCGARYENGADGGCVLCPAGKYKVHPGHEPCTPCPDQSTSLEGSASAEDCLCLPGFYFEKRFTSSYVCSLCPVGADCPGGNASYNPDAAPGFFKAGPSEWKRCLYPSVCLGGNRCAYSRVGPDCADCPEGFRQLHNDPSKCVSCHETGECEEPYKIALIVVAAVLVALIVATVWLWSWRRRRLCYYRRVPAGQTAWPESSVTPARVPSDTAGLLSSQRKDSKEAQMQAAVAPDDGDEAVAAIRGRAAATKASLAAFMEGASDTGSHHESVVSSAASRAAIPMLRSAGPSLPPPPPPGRQSPDSHEPASSSSMSSRPGTHPASCTPPAGAGVGDLLGPLDSADVETSNHHQQVSADDDNLSGPAGAGVGDLLGPLSAANDEPSDGRSPTAGSHGSEHRPSRPSVVRAAQYARSISPHTSRSVITSGGPSRASSKSIETVPAGRGVGESAASDDAAPAVLGTQNAPNATRSSLPPLLEAAAAAVSASRATRAGPPPQQLPPSQPPPRPQAQASGSELRSAAELAATFVQQQTRGRGA